MSLDEARQIQKKIAAIHIEESVLRYMTKIIRETRAIVGIGHGVSVRGGIQFLQAVRALAYVRGRAFVLPQDAKDLAIPCLAHRLFFNGMEMENQAKSQMIAEILSRVQAPQ